MTFHAMVLESPASPLVLRERQLPTLAANDVLVEVLACGVCRTDLHLVDSELPDIAYPIVPGHQIVGRVSDRGPDAALAIGTRVGIPWLGSTCQHCSYCLAGAENLCENARFTGYQIDGGYATHAVADSRYCLPLPDGFDDISVAPLLCAGPIGYRALRMCGDAKRIGLYGYGSAAHIISQVVNW